ncbi:MAG: MATE family efflux transporter [Flavobacteriales bacterium]|jgi:putative MATE family efflux protein|nr:MATE family efflux transporter [Flavobacteriales bacterium]
MSLRSTFTLVREAVLGNEDLDFTRMGVRRAIVLLSIPMVLEMGMEAVFALVDIFFVSRLGKEAIATVGLTEGVLTIVYSIAWGVGMGITAVVARRTGEKDAEGAAHAAMQGVLLTVLLGVVLALPGLLVPHRILELMGAEPAVVATGTTYMRLMLGGNVIILLLFAINAIFRGAGDAAMALRSLALANAVNIVLCPVLIHGIGGWAGLGVTGAALATTIGRGTGVAYQVYHLFNGRHRVSLRGVAVRLERAVMGRIVRVSAGGVAQFLIPSGSWVFLVGIVAGFGSAAVAGYTVAVRIIVFSLLPAWGMANAASTLVGQNLGAGQPGRAARSAWLCGHCNMVFMVGVAVCYWLAAPRLLGFFSTDPEVVAHGVEALRIVCLGYFFYAYGIVLAQAFNGAGDTLTPTWMNIICFWALEIPIAWWLAHGLGWGTTGVFAAIAISESALAVLSAVLFRRGRWALVKV